MAAANSKPTAAQIEKLETEMKTAFKGGRWEMVRKKADEIRKADPQNRVVERIMQKTQEGEKTAMKKANAVKIKTLEVKMDQSFKAGDLAAMTQAVEEVKKLDPSNAKALKAEATIAKAKAILDAEIRKEKIRKLAMELEISMAKADWGGVAIKANEILALEWENSVAMKALKRVAEAKKVKIETLITVQAPKIEKKPSFFARLFGKRAVEPAKVVAKESAKSEAKPGASFVNPMPTVKPVAPAKPAAETKPLAPTPASSSAKPSIFGSLVAKKEEPKPVLAPVGTPKPVVLTETKPTLAQDVKKTEGAKPISSKDEKKPSFFSRMFVKKAPAPDKGAQALGKDSSKPVIAPVAAKAEAKEAAKEPAKNLNLVSKLASAVDTKSKVPVAKPVESPMGVPIGVSSGPVKSEIKPAVPFAVPPAAEQAPLKPIESQLKVEQETVAKPESKIQGKGNIFTSLFGKEEVEKPTASVLETIVAKTAPEKAEPKKEKVPMERTGESFLGFSSAFLRLAIVFIAVSAAFLYVENIDANNTVLGIGFINKENNAIQLHNASKTIEEESAKVKRLNQEIAKYQGGYQDDHQEAIKKIVSGRMDWPSILKKLNEVTESVYEKNAISQYVQYNNYTYNSETSQLTVTGTLSDPLGKNLTKLAELEQAFKNYPKDPKNPDDDRKPYFYGLQEFNSFAKSFNNSTGRFQSTFNLTLYTKEQNR